MSVWRTRVRALFRVHPVLSVLMLAAVMVGGFAVGWDRVDPGPETITLILKG